MAKKLIDTKKIAYEEWVALRRRSVGGSEASTVMGDNKWSSPLSLYADKVGLTSNKETNVAMKVGTYCEELVAKMFEEETGKKVRNDFFMYEHDCYPFITANLDRRIVGENAGLECKTTQAYTLKDFEGTVPKNYYWQCQHYMGVMGFERMYLACILSNRHFVWRVIERDDEAIERLFEEEVRFWNEYIVPQVQPIAMAEDGEVLLELYPEAEEVSIVLDIDDEASMYLQAQAEIKKWEERKKMAQNAIEQKMGTADRCIGVYHKASWKNYETSRIDTKRLKEEEPELYAKYCKKTTSRRFSCKEAEDAV